MNTRSIVRQVIRKLFAIGTVVAMIAISLGPVFSMPMSASADATVSITTVNGVASGGSCIEGPITITGAGTTGELGGSWHLSIGWGDGTTTSDPVITSVEGLSGSNTSFIFSASHTPIAPSTEIILVLYHSQPSGNDGKVVVVSQCSAPANRAPVANDDTYNTDEGAELSVNVPGVIDNDTDDDSNPLTATLGTDVSNGTLVFNVDGSFTYTPNAEFSGVDSFTYTVSDSHVTSNPATVYINVSNEIDAPIAHPNSYSTNENAPVSISAPGVLGNDTDANNDALTAQLESDVNDGTLALSPDGSFTYTPDSGFSGTDSFTYKASDGSLFSSTQTVVISVHPINHAPSISAQSVTTLQNTPVYDVLGGSDRDGNTLVYATTTNPTHGTLTLESSSGAFTYTPESGYIGADSFSFKASDGTLESESAVVSISVNSVPENSAEMCADTIDNDSDELVDLVDPDCVAFIPAPPEQPENGGGGTTETPPPPAAPPVAIGNGPIAGSLDGTNNGNIFGGGMVLGASTSTSGLPTGCDALLSAYMRRGKNNDPEQVKKLQQFLNGQLGLSLPLSGFFGRDTDTAVRSFQQAHAEEVLTPWGITDPTGYVYKTTLRWINITSCNSLVIPMPELN